MESKLCIFASILIFAAVLGQVQGYTAIIMPQHDPCKYFYLAYDCALFPQN